MVLSKRDPEIVVEKDWRIIKLGGCEKTAASVPPRAEGKLATLLPTIAKQWLNRETEESLQKLITEQMIAGKGSSTRF